MKLLHLKIIIFLLFSPIFAQNESSSKNTDFSNLIYSLDELIVNNYNTTLSFHKKNKKLPIELTRENFYKIIKIHDELSKYQNENELYILDKSGSKVGFLNALEIQSFLYHLKYYIMNEFFFAVLDFMDDSVPRKDDIEIRDDYIEFLSDFFLYSSNIKISDWKSDMVKDESILDINNGYNSIFFVVHDWISPQLFDIGIYEKSKHAVNPISKYIVELEALEKIISSLQRWESSEDKFSPIRYQEDNLELYYNIYISALDIIVNNKYYFKDTQNNKDIFSCISCDINEYQRAFNEEFWFIWTEMLYFEELVSLSISSENGSSYQNKKGTKETLKSLERIITEIESIITPGYRYPLNSDFDTEIQSELTDKGFPEINHSKSLALTNDEFIQDLKFELFDRYIFSIQTYVEGGYDKEVYLLFENAQNIFSEFNYKLIKKISTQDPYRFETLYSSMGYFKLNYFLLSVLNMKDEEIDINQIGISKEFSNSLKNDYLYFTNEHKKFTQIGDTHIFDDKFLKEESKIIDDVVEWLIEIMTNPPLFFDVSKADKELRHIARSYGKDDAMLFSYNFLIGMFSNPGFILINEESFIKRFEEDIVYNPSIENIDTYINYYFYKELTNLVVKEYDLNIDNTQEDLTRIMNSDKYSQLLFKEFDEELYQKIKKKINSSVLGDMTWNSIKLIRIKDVQKEPELYSNTFKVLKNLVLLNSKYQELNEEESFKALVNQLILLGKIDTVLEFQTEDINYLLTDYFEISDKEVDEFIKNIYSTVVELGIPIVQTVFLEHYGMLELMNATYIITENEGRLVVQKKAFLHETSKPFVNNINTNISLLNKSLSKNLDSKDLQKKIYEALIVPILNLNLFKENGEDVLPIIFITNATTQSIPFTALIDENDNYLLDSFVFIRSNSILSLMSANEETLWNKEKPLLIAGDIQYEDNKEFSEKRIDDYGDLDNLKWSSNEVNAINKIEKNSLIKNNISETDFKNIDFSKYRSLHFSVHGTSIFENPGKSALFLGGDDDNDGILTVNEIRKLNLTSIDFVFLSACETNTGKRYSNLNPITLQTAFHQAGVNSTISTLWSIDDKATAYFSEIFYLLREETEFRFLALHRAKQLFIKTYPEYKNPYYWAAFTLDGF